MKFIIDNWMLISVALASGSLLLWSALAGARSQGIATTQAVQLINRERAQLLDVRTPEEFAALHAMGSRSVPLDELQTKLPTLVKNKSLPLILVCASGARAVRARKLAQDLGYAQVQVLSGGLAAWKEAQLPVNKLA